MKRWLSTFFIICLLTASAEALDEADADGMSNLVKQSLQLRKDLSNVKGGSPLVGKAWECLNELYHNLEMVSVRIDGLYSMMTIASLMNDKSDEQTVLHFLNEDATSFLDHVDISRLGINLTAGYCSSNNVAVAKAQGHLEKFLSPSRHESDSVTACGHERMERAGREAEGLFRC